MSTPNLSSRNIGGVSVSAIGYGAMGIGGAWYGSVESEEERLQFLDALYARGCTHWDTADAYADSEVLLGKWFARTGKRSEIFLATKFGIATQYGAKTSDGSRRIRGDPEYVFQQFEKSLERLQTDYIDLYYLHRVDTSTPIEHTIRAMASLVHSGKVRYLGLSECSARTLARAHAVHPISALQVEYSPFTLDIEDPSLNLLATARSLGVTIIAYSPLGRGLLTGQYKGPEDFEEGDLRRSAGVPRYSKENFPRILELVDGLKAIGAKHNATAGQVALAWLLAQGPDVIPIPGTRKLKYLDENLGALNVHLTPEEVEEVRRIAERADATSIGARVPPGTEHLCYADSPELEE